MNLQVIDDVFRVSKKKQGDVTLPQGKLVVLSLSKGSKSEKRISCDGIQKNQMKHCHSKRVETKK